MTAASGPVSFEGIDYEEHDLPPTRGPCDLERRGESADEVIKAQDRHLEEAQKAQDATHQAAREAMKGRWRRPRQAMDWCRGTKKAFAQAPDS